MKRENTASRLSTIMSERNLRQVDILERAKPYCTKYDIKMNKSDLSQYVSGKVEPSQEKLVILGMALNVSEAWLMGFDVPMERYSDKTGLNSRIMKYYEMLNDIGKREATKRVEELTYFPQYKIESSSNNENFNSEASDEFFTDPNKALNYLEKHPFAAFNGNLSDTAIIQMANTVKRNNDNHRR